jgi:hypothetical protein
MRRLGVSLLIVTLALITLTAQSSSNGSRGAKPYTTWTAYQGGSHSSQYSALDQINKANVSQLEVAWTYPVAGNITFNPIVVDNVMYVQGTGNAATPSSRSMRPRARSCGATRIRARLAPAVSTTGRARTARIGGCCI